MIFIIFKIFFCKYEKAVCWFFLYYLQNQFWGELVEKRRTDRFEMLYNIIYMSIV